MLGSIRKLLGGVTAEFPWWGQNSFTFWAQDSFRCNEVVNIIEDWDVLAEYDGEKLGFFQILVSDGAVEIRALTGKVAFKHEFASRDDPIYNKMLSPVFNQDFDFDAKLENGTVTFTLTQTQKTPKIDCIENSAEAQEW